MHFCIPYFVFFIISISSSHGMAQNPISTDILTINGHELYYEVYGEGEPLLLLHGWTQSSQYWADYISGYAAHHRVYTIDLRGHGHSAPLTDDFSIKNTAQDISKLIDHLELGQVKAVGLSFGSLVLLELACMEPNKIKSMVLIAATHSFNGADNSNPSFTYDDLPPAFKDQLAGTHHHGENQIRALFNPNLDYAIDIKATELKKIKTKTMIINGDNDQTVGLNGAISMHQHIPHSHLWIVPHQGHIPITKENRSSYIKITNDFLKEEE